MKIYVSMNPLPWEQFSMNIPNTDGSGEPLLIKAHSSATRAGFLPIFWTQEEAEKTFPDVPWQAAEVADDWHPMLNRLRENVEAQQAEEIRLDASTDETPA